MSDEEQANGSRPMAAAFELITTQLKNISENQNKMANRLEKLESKEQAPPLTPNSPRTSGHLNADPDSDIDDITAGQQNGGFEKSDDEKSDEENEQELDFNIQNYLLCKKSGPYVQQEIALYWHNFRKEVMD